MNHKIMVFAFVFFSVACNNNNTVSEQPSPGTGTSGENNSPQLINYSVINAFPHDTASYTEGFLFHDGRLYESTGTTPEMPGSRRSLFGVVDLKTGKIEKKAELDRAKYFGEGITILNGKLYQLTWQNHIGYLYDAHNFHKLGEFTYDNDGWGMTTDGTYLIMSDGSSNLSYHEPTNFKLVKILGVTDNNGPVANINELEFINGYIYANIYQTSYIDKIEPLSGKVVGRLDLTTLTNETKSKYPEADYLNGIAYDSSSGHVYVTGKLWPNIYEISFSH